MVKIFKTLYIKDKDVFVHFEQSDVSGEVYFLTGDMPMLMSPNVEVEDLLTFLGQETIFPEGTELKTIEIKFKDEQYVEEKTTED